MSADRTQTSVRFPPDLLARIENEARRRVIGRNLLILRLIEIGLDALADPLPDMPPEMYGPDSLPIPTWPAHCTPPFGERDPR